MKGRIHALTPFLSVLLATLIILAIFTACGRKGDPVLITPDDKIAAEDFFGNDQDGGGR